MSSLQKFAKAVVEGDLEGIDVHRRAGSEIVVVGKSDGWNGSVGAWQVALSTALGEVEMPRLSSLLVQSKTSTIEPMNMQQFPAKSTASQGLENSLRIVVISACANGTVEFRHIQRAVDVVRPMLTPLPAEDEKVDALPIVESLVNEGKLERVRWARDEENGRTSDPMTAMYAIRNEVKARGKRR